MLSHAVPGRAWLEGRRPFVRLLAEAAAELGGRLEMEHDYGHLGRYTAPDGRRRPIFGNALGLNPDAAAATAADKDYAARLLAAEGLPAPEGIVVFGPAYVARMRLKNAAVAARLPGAEAAAAFAARAGWPVIAKPNAGSEGRGVTRAATSEELAADLARLFETDDRVRVERVCPGADHRVVVLEGRARIAYRRRPATLTGDGRHSVAELLEAARAHLAATQRGPKLDPADVRIARALAEAGLTAQSVPEAGRPVPLLPNANLSTGGACEDLTDRLAPEAAALAVRAAEALGLRLAGVDILAPDLAAGTAGTAGAVVLEVNSAPGLDGYAMAGPAQWSRARALLAEALAAP